MSAQSNRPGETSASPFEGQGGDVWDEILEQTAATRDDTAGRIFATLTVAQLSGLVSLDKTHGGRRHVKRFLAQDGFECTDEEIDELLPKIAAEADRRWAEIKSKPVD